MRMINYVRLQNNVKAQHNHPLTQMSANPPPAGVSVLVVTSGTKNICSTCQDPINLKEGQNFDGSEITFDCISLDLTQYF